MGCGCGKIITGATGLAKAVTGIDQAEKETIAQRREICRGCADAVPCPFSPNKKCLCGVCGCLLVAKTKLKKESCPKAKW